MRALAEALLLILCLIVICVTVWSVLAVVTGCCHPSLGSPVSGYETVYNTLYL